MNPNFDPCWILTNPRSGSSYLSSCLNNALNRAGYESYKFEEWFNLFSCCTTRPEKIPRFCNLHRIQFCDFFTNEDRLNIELLQPNMRYIHLRRRDVIAQTVSFFLMMESGIQNISNSNWIKKPIDYNEDILLRFYLKIKDSYHNWDDYLNGVNHLAVDYEELFSSFDLISNYLQLDVKPDGKYVKLVHPETDDYVCRFGEFVKTNGLE